MERCVHAKPHIVINIYVDKKGESHKHTYTYYRCQRTCCRKKRADRKKESLKSEYIGY